MADPQITRPHFPEGYLEKPKTLLPWSHVEERLKNAKNYWLCTLHPDGHPHVIPKWGVWVEGRIYFDGSLQTRHARNIARNPRVALHLESGDDVVIVNGYARALPKPSAGLASKIAFAYAKKYSAQGYAPQPTQWDNGGLFEITPQTVLAWTSFVDDPTKFILESRQD